MAEDISGRGHAGASAPGRQPVWYKQLIRFCRRRGRSVDDARDLVQEACLRMIEYKRSAAVRDEDSLLRRIVLNLDINQWHRERPITAARCSIKAIDRQSDIAASRPGPDRILAAHQELEYVADYLGAVSRRTFSIFIAQRAGYSYAELAAGWAIAERTIEKHVTRAAEIVSTLKRP